jgi:hydrophobic/amphiphilic exporter-1 (mainly G- bacteria), HAE1 family
MNLVKKAIDRPVTSFMIFVCFVLIGVIASGLLPMEYMPELDFPFVGIDIPYPGSTPEEVERQITRPIEEALATISGVKRMTSNSNENNCSISMRFEWGTDTKIKSVEIKEKIDSIRHLLPSDIERIHLNQASASDQEILQLRLSSKRDLSEYYNMLNRVLKQPLERVLGVSRVNMYGVEKKEIRIQLISNRITAHRIDLGQLSETLRKSNFMVTGGRITDTNRRYRIKPMGEINSIKEVEDLIIGKNNLKLKDIAKVTYDRPILDYGRHLDMKYAVGLDLFKESGANTVDTVKRAIKELDRIGKDPRMEGISIYFMNNQADGITSSLNELLKSGIIGASLAVLLLFFFLRRWATTFIVALAVPFSLIVTLAFMFFFKQSLNILSMMGLMLAVGMLVDNAVVVTESIHRHQLNNGDSNRKKASLNGVKEVALAITAGTITTAIVFLPSILSHKDEFGIFMKHVSISFVIALGASLLLAQTIVPLLTSLVKLPKKKPKAILIDRLMNRYGKILDWMIRKPKASAILVILILVSVVIPGMFVKRDMFPEQDARRLFLPYFVNGNYTVEKVEKAVFTIEDYLYKHQEEFEIKSVYSYYTGDSAQSTINLTEGKDAKKSLKQIRNEIEKGLPKLAIAKPSFERRRSMGGDSRLRIYLRGKSSERLVSLTQNVAKTLEKIPGISDARSDAEAGDQEVQVVVDRDRAAIHGLSASQVANMVAVAMRGVNLKRFRDEYGEIDVRVEFQEGDRQTMDNLKKLILYGNDGLPVKLASIADIRMRKGPRYIHRVNRITSMGISISLTDLTVTDAQKSVDDMMNQYHLPAGYSWSYGRSFSNEEEVFNNMMINLFLALFLIYFIMASLFESLILPAAIWSSIIFAIVGVFWFFWMTGTTFSIMALIGILILIGVVVNNGIVLIDHIKRFRDNGFDRHSAIVEAGKERIRPILMTAGTTVLSLVPLCIVNTQIGGDGPPYYPMARAIVGGLTFSTIVTLLLLPRIYIMLDDLRNWARSVIKKANQMAG